MKNTQLHVFDRGDEQQYESMERNSGMIHFLVLCNTNVWSINDSVWDLKIVKFLLLHDSRATYNKP